MKHRFWAALALPLLLLACSPIPQQSTSSPTSPRPLAALEAPAPQVYAAPAASDPRQTYTLTPGASTLTVNGVPVIGPVVVRPGDAVQVVTSPPVFTPLPLPPDVWLPLAREGQTFTVTGSATVRYGAGTAWVSRVFTGPGECSNAVFGDPLVGTGKTCELLERPGVSGVAVIPPVVVKPPAPVIPVYSAPLVITRGGTYTGNWESLDPKVPAVLVKTSEPVVIENCLIRSKSHLIMAPWTKANLTVRNCRGQGLNPDVVTRGMGRFVHAEGFQSVLIERNTLSNTAGIYLNSWNGVGTAPVVVRQNLARDIDGRYSDGNGGWQKTFYRVQFVQLNAVKNAPGVSIGWNRVENTPRLGHVEDVINLYNSSGTPTSPIRVHDNLIRGAYAGDPAASYSGGGIMLGDGGGAHQEAVSNTVLETSNYGIAVAGGNDMRISGNTVLGTGKLADGTRLDADPDAGIYLRDYAQDTGHLPATVIAKGNTVGWGRPRATNPNARWDLSISKTTATNLPVGSESGTLRLPAGPVPDTALQDADLAWDGRAAAGSILIGAP